MTLYERIAPEQYDSLPGVPEPGENPVLAGHEETLERLLAAFRRGKLHHALLLHGPKGIGKATLAFHLARQVLGGPERAAASDPASPLFRQIAMGSHPSVLHLTRPLDKDGKKFKTAITVDEVRRIGNLLAHTAHDQRYRVVIVDPADDMNGSAANALLKGLEEPPAGTLFILISHRPGGLLPTIRSRCHAIRLQPLSDEDVKAVLSRSGLIDQASELAARAGGSPRNAMLMSEYGGLEIASAVTEILAASPFDVDKAHRLADAVGGRGAEIQFDLFNEQILEIVSEEARRAGKAGDVEKSGRLAVLWNDTQEKIRTAGIYNLDRKQHVVGTLLEIRAGLSK